MPARSSRTPSRRPPRPICSGRPSAGPRRQREQPGGHQPHPLGVEVEAGGDVGSRTAGEHAQRAREALARRARRRPAGAATPRCRRPRPPRRPAAERSPASTLAACSRTVVELGRRRRVAAQVGVGEEAGAERERRRPLDAAVERPDGDLGRTAADVDHRDAAAAAAVRACASRPGRPAAPPPRRRARTPRRRRARASRAQNSSRLAARRITAVATARIARAPACSASASCSATTLAVSAIRAAGIAPPGASPRPRRVNARRCRTS